jgi:phosphatidylinositol-bisphosphatase
MVFGQFNPPKSIKDHDMVYWLGDLNYRITDLEAPEVKDLLRENNLALLMDADQFKQQRFQRKVGR